MSSKEKLVDAFIDIANEAASMKDYAAAIEKVHGSKLGQSGGFILGFLVGTLVGEFGADETDRILSQFVAGIRKQVGHE